MVNNTKVIKIQCPFERIKKYNATPESALYKAVIMQMIIDASNISQDPKACRNEKRAKAWLFTNNEDFSVVCTMAGIEKQVVTTFAKALIAMHCEKVIIKNAAKIRATIKPKTKYQSRKTQNVIATQARGRIINDFILMRITTPL
jgi:hypothetical protein